MEFEMSHTRRSTMDKGWGRFAPLIALAVVALGAWVAGTSAAPPANAPSKDVAAALWAQLDVNGDGRISAAEGAASAAFKANFEMADADRDGFVSESEYRSANAAKRQSRDVLRQQRRDDMGEEEEERRHR